MDKSELRKLAKQKLLGKKAAERKEAALKLSKNIKDFLQSLDSKTDIIKTKGETKLIGGFSPMADELEWHLCLTDTDLHPCVPSIGANGEMEFHKVSWKLLSKEFLGLRLDKGFPQVWPDVIIIPGLAFSTDGKRLGRGKGYYDRYLEKNRAVKIGVCSEEQIFENITIEDHDVLMDFVITDKNIYRRGNRDEY